MTATSKQPAENPEPQSQKLKELSSANDLNEPESQHWAPGEMRMANILIAALGDLEQRTQSCNRSQMSVN